MLSWVFNSVSDTVFDVILTVITSFNGLMGQILLLVQKGLVWMLQLKMTEGLPVVGAAWVVLRDFANMFFIVILIIISFATIFNALGKFGGYSYQNALRPLIIAAILINFSMAIGQTVVAVSNQVAQIFVNLMPDPGSMLIGNLQPQQFALNSLMPPPAANAAVDARATLTAAEKTRFNQCLTEQKDVKDTNAGFFKYLWQTYTGGTKVPKTMGDCNLEIVDARNGASTGAATAARLQSQAAGNPAQPTTNTKIMLIFSGLMTIIATGIIISCLITALIFLALRIIMVWILLAASPLAFASSAMPGKSALGKWWNQFLAWNVFGPLYLFSLIPGMVMLAGSGTVMAILNRAGGDSGGPGSLIQIVFYYIFAMMVFIGGLNLSLKSSFASAVAGSGMVGKWASKLGVFDSMGAAPARFVGRTTGISDNLQAIQERGKQTYEQRTAAARRALGIKTSEESLATARARFGVKAGAEAVEKINKAKIDDERKHLEDPFKKKLRELEIAKSQTTDEKEREDIDGKIKQLKDDHVEDLKDKMHNSKNRNESLAAGEVLMDDDKIDDPKDLQEMAEKYAKVSPAAMSGFVERRDTALKKNASKHKFKSTSEMQGFVSLMSSSKQAGEYYKELKKGKSKVIALQLGTQMSLERKPNGDKYQGNELLLKEAPKFNSDDWLAAEQLMAEKAEVARKNDPQSKRTELDEMADVSEDFRDWYLQKFLSPKSKNQLTVNATKEQRIRFKKAAKVAESRRGVLIAKRKQDKLEEDSGGAQEEGGSKEKKEEKEDKKEEKKEDKKEDKK